MTRKLQAILKARDIQPVLVDVGASGAMPAIWQGIAGQSLYVGFDPDRREMQEIEQGTYRKSVIINSALTPDRERREVEFYLTHSPQCSSTLKPDADALAHYLFSDSFRIERQETVEAVTLHSILARLSLTGMDWLKLDTQGTDLRLWQSLPPEIRSQVLAVELEPGLMDAYIGEDLFTDVHETLTREGFWLSDLQVRGTVRLKIQTLKAALGGSMEPGVVEQVIKRSPGWVEARYLRTLEALAQAKGSPREYILLWVFALLDQQPGFALDLALDYEKAFGTDALSQTLRDEPLRQIRRAVRRRRLAGLAGSPMRLLRRLRRRLLP